MSFFSEISKTTENTFHTMSRIGNDVADDTQKTVQNVRESNYIVSNFRGGDCTMKRPIALATSQPSMFCKGGNSIAADGCNIDESSELLIGGSAISKSRSKLTLAPRAFLSVPYMGKGATDPDLEANLRHGEMATNRKSVRPDSELSYTDYHHYPLIPEVKRNIQNSQRMVEESAADGWIRGGVPSRSLVRETM